MTCIVSPFSRQKNAFNELKTGNLLILIPSRHPNNGNLHKLGIGRDYISNPNKMESNTNEET